MAEILKICLLLIGSRNMLSLFMLFWYWVVFYKEGSLSGMFKNCFRPQLAPMYENNLGNETNP